MVNLTQFLFNFTSEIRTVKLGVFSFSPIAPVCGAVKLGGDIYRRYIPQVHNFTRREGRDWEASFFSPQLTASQTGSLWCGETGKRRNGEYYFPYRTVSGETGKQGEYIYPRYILPFHRFSTGAKGAVGSSSWRDSPCTKAKPFNGSIRTRGDLWMSRLIFGNRTPLTGKRQRLLAD